MRSCFQLNMLVPLPQAKNTIHTPLEPHERLPSSRCCKIDGNEQLGSPRALSSFGFHLVVEGGASNAPCFFNPLGAASGDMYCSVRLDSMDLVQQSQQRLIKVPHASQCKECAKKCTKGLENLSPGTLDKTTNSSLPSTTTTG